MALAGAGAEADVAVSATAIATAHAIANRPYSPATTNPPPSLRSEQFNSPLAHQERLSLFSRGALHLDDFPPAG